MNGWLLDTNVVSELRRPRPNARVIVWMREAGTERLFLSTTSFAEMRFGIELETSPNNRLQLYSWLDVQIRPMFAERVLEVDEQALFEWRVLGDAASRKRRTIPEPDLLLSAVARRHQLIVASRDVRHLAMSGVPVFNPWTGQSFNTPA
jgi:toxin FitB